MFKDELRAAAEKAPRGELQQLAGMIWRALAAGQLSEYEAGEIAVTIDNRLKASAMPADRLTPRRGGSRPKSAASLERRRRWVAAGLMPPQVAASFTMGEASALAVIALEISKRRVCTLAIGAIAAIAGVGQTTVRNALRQAKELGLLHVRERRRTRFRNDTNIVSVVSAEWKAWLRLGEKTASRDSLQKRGGHAFQDNFRRSGFAPFERHGREEMKSPKRFLQRRGA